MHNHVVKDAPLFGTDGIRGKANVAPMDGVTTLQIAMAVAHVMRRGDHKHRVIIGKDTRLSGYMIENAMSAGFTAMGMEVILVGPLPTPAIAMLTRSMRCDIGVVISASHNPYHDNGIKFFTPHGHKIDDDTQQHIEQCVRDKTYTQGVHHAVGRARRLEDAKGRAIEFVKSRMPKNLNLHGMKIVIDCAHGASYKIAPTILWELEGDVVTIGADPNGININDGCGATHPEALRERVILENADIGIALDGDGDRVILVDEHGQLANGDQLLAVLARHRVHHQSMPTPYVVGTSLSNIALQNYLESVGLQLLRADVGDRQVARMMHSHNAVLGGEHSGHIIFGDKDDIMSGDGLRAALEVLAIMKNTDTKASQLLHPFTAIPAVEHKVACVRQGQLLKEEGIARAVESAHHSLKQHGGSLVVRPSGTEPCIRITAQSHDAAIAQKIVTQLAELMEQRSLATV